MKDTYPDILIIHAQTTQYNKILSIDPCVQSYYYWFLGKNNNIYRILVKTTDQYDKTSEIIRKYNKQPVKKSNRKQSHEI